MMDVEREEWRRMEAGAGPVNRSIVLASADPALRHRLRVSLSGRRWQVREAMGGAEAMVLLDREMPEVLVVDHWLPDLEVGEFAEQIGRMYPGVELLKVDGELVFGDDQSPRRHELQHALREAGEEARKLIAAGGAAGEAGTIGGEGFGTMAGRVRPEPVRFGSSHGFGFSGGGWGSGQSGSKILAGTVRPGSGLRMAVTIDEMIGDSEGMLELARLIRMVAPRSTTVLIEGETGTGKEIVAQALHRLSSRAARPFAVLNCAAIPEALLEAELFGHTRGAFTGAVHARTGRIEAANGGTLFLDEIGEMPLGLQSKMLRFLECGELQRVGENDVVRVDVRVIAATHQPLEARAAEGTFRLDLYHRLAVFPIEIPPLRRRKEDITTLAEHFLEAMGKTSPRKRLSDAALERLHDHGWPGNVRELAHVLERATILAGDEVEIRADHIRVRRATRA